MEILFVEDDEASSQILTRRLEKLGHKVTVERDGHAALEQFSQKTFGIIISDWEMPGMDGLELCSAVRSIENRPYTYLLLFTARDSREDRLKALAAGADDYLTKPLDREELVARLQVASRILDMQEELRQLNLKLLALSKTDGLTGLDNHRSMQDELENQFNNAMIKSVPLSIIMVDVDNFKKLNDTFGHQIGDEVLKQFAEILRANVRPQDTVARYGGEEFAIILPEMSLDQAIASAERLRLAIETATWPKTSVTASFGVTCWNLDQTHRTQLMNEADKALYASKMHGRNRVTAYHELTQ